MSRIGKITIYVDQTMHNQVVSIRTTGKSGSVSLNTVSTDQGYNYRTASVDAKTFWASILTLAQAQVAALP